VPPGNFKDDYLGGSTFTVPVACNTPASGPESKLVTSCNSPELKSLGTRTEAVQNEPQANPDWACCKMLPLALTRLISACELSEYGFRELVPSEQELMINPSCVTSCG
jgi:hypothetical protein